MTGSIFGTWQRCPICKEWGYSAGHWCAPEWEACDADDQEWETVRARDAEDAAECYCALRDPYNEYGAVSASRTVLVRQVGRNDLRRRYIVEGELQPVYIARIAPFIDEDGGAV